MKKLFLWAIAAVGLLSGITSCSSSKDVVGSWQLFNENGERQSGYTKNYLTDGTFTVTEKVKTSSECKDNVKVEHFADNVVQRGTWEMPDKKTIIEKCQMGNKGDVKIAFNLKKNILEEKFAYAANPEKPFTQKFFKYSNVPAPKKRTREIKIKHCGTMGGYTDGNVYILDGKHYNNVADYNKNIPDNVDLIESIDVIKSGDAFNYLTEKEIAAGKSSVVLVKLKK